MVRTRSEVHNNPTVIDLKQQARGRRKQEWLAFYETLRNAIMAGEVKDYFAGQAIEDEEELDKMRLFIRLLYGFPFEQYIPVNREISIVTLLLRELEKSLGRMAYPGTSEALISDCTEEETKRFVVAKRALVCSYVEKLQSFREGVTIQETGWTKGLDIYRAMALSLFREYLDTTTYLLFLSGDNLGQAVQAHSNWVKESVLPVIEMLNTAFSDDNISVPVLFQDFPEAGETFLSFPNSALENVPDLGQQKQEPKEEKPGGAETFVPGLSSTRRESRTPSGERKDLQRQQRLKAVFESESLTPQQKQFMMENIMREYAEEDMGMQSEAGAMTEEMDSLSKRFHLQIEETGFELYSSPQPYSGQYHSLPDVKLPNFYSNPLEFHKFYAMFTCLVDRNPKIPKIMKLHLLSNSLKGTANYLTYQITFSPGSYDQLKRNLEKAFGDTESSLSQLRERLIAFPIVPENKYKDLAQFFGFATNYVMSLLQYEDGATFNARAFCHELHCKFNQRMRSDYQWSLDREETLRGKMRDRNKLDFMLDWMEKQVSMARTFYHADPSNPKIRLGQPSGIAMEFGDNKGNQNKKKDSMGGKGGCQHEQKSEPEDTTTVLATDTVAATATNNMGGGAARGGRGGGRGRGGARGGRGRGGGGGRGRGRGSTSATSTARSDQPTSGGKDNSEREVIPCCFCNNPRHSSNNCTQKMKPDTVYVKALEFQLCLNCLKAGHWASLCPHPGCDQDNCRGRHHRTMHGRSKELGPSQNS